MASYFGPVSYRFESGEEQVVVRLEFLEQRSPQEVYVHLRRPERQKMRSVSVNRQPHADFDVNAETVCISPVPDSLEIRAEYEPHSGEESQT